MGDKLSRRKSERGSSKSSGDEHKHIGETKHGRARHGMQPKRDNKKCEEGCCGG